MIDGEKMRGAGWPCRRQRVNSGDTLSREAGSKLSSTTSRLKSLVAF